MSDKNSFLKDHLRCESHVKEELKDNISKIKAMLSTIESTEYLQTVRIDEEILKVYLKKRLTALYHEQKINKQNLEKIMKKLEDAGELELTKSCK